MLSLVAGIDFPVCRAIDEAIPGHKNQAVAMGVYDRDYYRNEPHGGGLLGGMAPACKWLIAINVAVYVVQVLSFNSPGHGATGWLQLSPQGVVRDWEVWRIVTSAFCHDPRSPIHILFNMWMLWFCGSQVEAIYGQREFVRFYLAAAIFSGLIFAGFSLFNKALNPMVGASGAIMAVTVVCAMYYPTQQIRILFVIPLEMRWLVVISAIFDVYPILDELGGGGARDGVAHSAHLGGLLYGFLYKRFDLRFNRLFGNLSLPRFGKMVRTSVARRKATVRLYEPPAPTIDLTQKVDEILAKITSHGESSLTEAEREILKEASRKYKNR